MLRFIRLASWSLLIAFCATACHSASPSSTTSTAPSNTPTAARLSVSRTTYDFPDTLVGSTTTSSAFALTTSGTGSLTVMSITSSNPTEFPIADASTNCVGMTLNGTACQLAVNFKPAAPGVRTAQISVTGSDGNNVAITVYGQAIVTGLGGSGGSGGSGGGGGGSPSGSNGSFPLPACVQNGTQNISLSIVNTMTFLVQVSLDGPTHQTSNIAGSAVQLYPLVGGTYTISGTAPGQTNVTFNSSSWTVTPGCDYLMQVVVVTN